MKQIHETYGDKVRVVFKHNPLPFHKDAPLASQAAWAAQQQGKFWEMHKVLFQNQSGLTAENFTKWAGELKLNLEDFAKCSADPAVKAAVDADMQAGAAAGVDGTPAFFINGISLSGAQPLEAFVNTIDAELERLSAAQ